MLRSLMMSRRFAPLFWCQFFSAFTDNLVKQALIILIAFQLAGPDAGPLIQLTNVALLAPTFLDLATVISFRAVGVLTAA